MSESAELTALPIFPLAVVLLPGELLPLHIFEERYKAMMAAALDGDRQFGLCYVSDAAVGRDSAPPAGSVGCVAQITAVVPLPEGRMNVLAVGGGRYVVRGYSQREPFLVAHVDPLADEPAGEEIAGLAAQVRELFGRLAVAARSLASGAGDAELPKLDVEPEMLSFVVAANVGLDAEAKQQMLELTDTRERLERLRARLLDLVETYEYRAEMHARAKSNGHGERQVEVDEDE